MFKGYVIVEQQEDRIRVRHVATGDISWRYKATCSKCGKERGWKKISKLNGKCKGCAQRDEFQSSLSPIDHPNVTLSDFYVHKKPKGGSEVRYKTSCLGCSRDRGYITLYNSKKLCRSCVRKQVHANSPKDLKYETARKISMTQTGASSFSGFKTPLMDKQRDIFKSKNLSKQCFQRDDYVCQCCSARGVALNAHHLNGFDKFPEQRFDLSNLLTLCKGCHDNFHAQYGKGNNTKEQYLQFTVSQKTKVIYVLTGVPASGKSWVLSNSNNISLTTIDSDAVAKKQLINECQKATNPLVAITVGVTTFIKRNPQFACRLIVIQEAESVINQRMMDRGGKVTRTISKRIERMKKLAKRAIFSGTSSEVLEFINNL